MVREEESSSYLPLPNTHACKHVHKRACTHTHAHAHAHVNTHTSVPKTAHEVADPGHIARREWARRRKSQGQGNRAWNGDKGTLLRGDLQVQVRQKSIKDARQSLVPAFGKCPRWRKREERGFPNSTSEPPLHSHRP